MFLVNNLRLAANALRRAERAERMSPDGRRKKDRKKMAGQPEKILQHKERERVLALSHLFDPDPERPDEIAPSARQLPLPEGLSSRTRAADELNTYHSSRFADVRRLAASALGKMTLEHPAVEIFLFFLARVAVEDPHPQVRQYAAKAIGRYPKEAFPVQDQMKDLARDESAPSYVRSAASQTVAALQTAHRSRFALLHQRAAKKLISVSFHNDDNLIGVLKEKLSLYIRLERNTERKMQ